MSKKNNSKVSKKNYPGLKRVVVEGKRVWEYQGGFFDSLKELDMSKNPSKYMTMKFTPKENIVYNSPSVADNLFPDNNITAEVVKEFE